MNINLTAAQTKELIKDARSDIVAHILQEHRDDLRLLSVQQVAGMLDVNPKTLTAMKIPRVVLIPNKVIKYKLADVVKFINDNWEK